MKPELILRISADLAMIVLLLLLMTYDLIGQAAHEWLGIAMFLLFILHHVLNRRWLKSVFRGKYTPMRVLQTVTAFLVLRNYLSASAVLLSAYSAGRTPPFAFLICVRAYSSVTGRLVTFTPEFSCLLSMIVFMESSKYAVLTMLSLRLAAFSAALRTAMEMSLPLIPSYLSAIALKSISAGIFVGMYLLHNFSRSSLLGSSNLT